MSLSETETNNSIYDKSSSSSDESSSSSDESSSSHDESSSDLENEEENEEVKEDAPTRQRKIDVKCVANKKKGKKVQLRREDGYYSWLGFVNRYRERDLAKRTHNMTPEQAAEEEQMTLHDAFKEIKENKAWENYNIRNGLQAQHPKKLHDNMLTWVKFGQIWNYIHPKMKWIDLLQDIKQPYKDYLEDHENYVFPSSNRVVFTTDMFTDNISDPADVIQWTSEYHSDKKLEVIMLVDPARASLFKVQKGHDLATYKGKGMSERIYSILNIEGEEHKLNIPETNSKVYLSEDDETFFDFNGEEEDPPGVGLIHSHFPPMPKNEGHFADYVENVVETISNLFELMRVVPQPKHDVIVLPVPLLDSELKHLEEKSHLLDFFAHAYLTAVVKHQDLDKQLTVIVQAPKSFQDSFYRVIVEKRQLEKKTKIQDKQQEKLQEKKDKIEIRKAKLETRKAQKDARGARKAARDART